MKRLHCDSAIWHVFARGCRRLELFRDDQDFLKFLDLLDRALKSSGCVLWAYALMTNHYHLLLEGGSKALEKCMHALNGKYSRQHNERYSLGGHVFDGPYQSYRQRTPLLSLATAAYVFMNPVKAGLCAAPEDYPWSGYRSFIGESGSPLAIDPTGLIARAEVQPRRAWQRFREAIRREAKRPPKPSFGRPTMVEVHQEQFEWLLDHARKSVALLSGEDPVPVSIYWGRQCGISPRAMARALGLPGAAVREALRRFKTRMALEPSLARLAAVP
ncbi:MAG TPA: transposase [Planctomycetota bacterium]|nr:transposase [Planctomycetota bacterium]